MIDGIMVFLYDCCIPVIPKLFERYQMDYENSDYLPTVLFKNYGQHGPEIQYIENPFRMMVDKEILEIVPIFKWFLNHYKKLKDFKGFCETISDLNRLYLNDSECSKKLEKLNNFMEKIKPFNPETVDRLTNEFWFEIQHESDNYTISLKNDEDYIVRWAFLTVVYSHIKKRLKNGHKKD